MCVQNNILGDCITTRKSLCVLANVFGKKRLSIEICVSLSIKKEYTKLSMHEYVCVCVSSIDTHTSQRTPGVYCRRVSLNVDQQL